MPGMTSYHAQNDIMPGHIMPRMQSFHTRDDIMSFQGMSYKQLWLVLADLAALRLCWAKQAHFADRCCACWWTGLVLRAAVTAVRGVSFKPIHPLPLSAVYAGVIVKTMSHVK